MVLLSDTTLSFESRHPLRFLYPSDPNDGPTKDTVVSGYIVLHLSRPKKVKRLLIELYGKQYIQLHGVYQDYETFKKSLTMNLFEQYGELPAGDHRFAFFFPVSANTAPFDFCAWGRTQHYMKATAVGCGSWNSDVVARQEVDLVANTAPSGQLAPGFDKITESFHETFGPYRLHLYSKYMLRGGYLRLALSMPSVSKPVRIENIQVTLKQDGLIQCMPRPELSEQKVVNIILWSLKDEGLAPLTLSAGKDFNIIRQLRLIGETARRNATEERVVRPSTSPWSETGIRIEHSIITTIRFTTLEPEDEMREIKLKSATTIASCACSIENLQLPGYAESSAHAQSASQVSNKTTHEWRIECLCHRPEDNELEQLYGASKVMMFDDQFGAERDRRPFWMDKVDDERAGDEVIGDLMRR